MNASAEADLRAELEERLGFETLLTEISTRFVSVPPNQADGEIEDVQRAICECLGLDHSSLWQASPEDPDTLLLTHLYRSPDLLPRPRRMSASDFFPWAQRKLHAKEVISIADTSKVPPEAARDLETWRRFEIKSTLGLPLSVAGGPVFGVLSFDATRENREWPESLKKRLQLVAQVFASALARKHGERTLHDSRARLSLAAHSANAGLWTFNPRSGAIWATDKAFELFGLRPDDELDYEKFLTVVHPEDRAVLQCCIDDAVATGDESKVEYRIIRADGSVRWIASRGRLQPGDNGWPDIVMGVSIDITEAKHLQQELKDLRERLESESDYLQEEGQCSSDFHNIVGKSKALKKVFRRIEQVAATDSLALITGETGTGKELVARAIHNLSRRKDRVMVKVDCASLPPTLIENELFGRERGAYTGALTQQSGRFELANGATLFLDEIGELPLELQAKLLRVVQDGEFERLGGPRTIKVDVRIIAATHCNLATKVKDGTFREDLFYRLNVFPIHVPPLRDRRDDIPPLAWTFIREFGKRMGKKIDTTAADSMALLQAYSWPGNIRELRNVIEQAVIVSVSGQLNLQMPQLGDVVPSPTLREAQYRHILTILEKTGWRIKGPRGAAQILGLEPSTLYAKMERLGLPTKRQKDQILTSGR